MVTNSPSTAAPTPRRFGEGPLSGAAVVMAAKLLSLLISLGSLAILGRLLSPADYGVVSMVTSITAFMTVFSDLGLSLVTVQRKDLTAAQASTLFWINQAFGCLLFLVTAALAPVLVWFYGDDRLLLVTLAIGTVFPLMSLGIQHQALLKRAMKFRHLAVVRLIASVGGCVVAVCAAWRGLGYWALVLQPIASASLEMVATHIAYPWRPGRPRACEGIRGMLTFGGSLAAHGMTGYFSNNLDNVLLGRVWGSHELGLYSACYGLMMRPVAIAGYSIGETAIPAMCREAASADRQRGVYRRMLTVTALVGLPLLMAGALYSPDVVRVLLGPQWSDAAPILSLLLLAAVPRLLWTSTGWVYVSTGRPGRMFRWQLITTPIVVFAFFIGLPFGALGVATAYATVNWLVLVPAFAFCFRNSAYRAADVLQAVTAPLACAALSCAAGAMFQQAALPHLVPGATRLAVELLVAVALYGGSVLWSVPLTRESLRKIIARFHVSPTTTAA